MAQCAVRFCEICEHSPGKQYCMNCEQYFCNDCKLSHLKAKVSKTHKFQNANEVNPEVKIPKCEQHHESFVFFCYTCESLLCQVCLTETHKKHDFSLINEAVSKKRSETKSKIMSAEKGIDELQKENSILESRMRNFHEHNKIVINDIDSRRNEIIEMVNTAADYFITRVKQHETKESQRMKQEIEKREISVQEGRKVIEDTKKALQGEDETMILFSIIGIQTELMSIKLPESRVNMLHNVKFTRTPAQIKEIETLIGNLDKRPTSIRVGDRVKFKDSVTAPKYRWGNVGKNSIGIVTTIDGNILWANFPEQDNWGVDINELELLE